MGNASCLLRSKCKNNCKSGDTVKYSIQKGMRVREKLLSIHFLTFFSKLRSPPMLQSFLIGESLHTHTHKPGSSGLLFSERIQPQFPISILFCAGPRLLCLLSLVTESKRTVSREPSGEGVRVNQRLQNGLMGS